MLHSLFRHGAGIRPRRTFLVQHSVICFCLSLGLALGVVLPGLVAAEFPQAVITSSTVRATIYLPDPQNGYYRATRFDWSGVVASLESGGHRYFGKWFDRYDPKIHDAIMGPVEEFLTKGAGLGYDAAAPGGSFVRIGVGAVRKPEEPAYRRYNTYEILDTGKWTVRNGRDWIEFVQVLTDVNGYAYVYRKRLSLAKDRPELAIDHSLKNTGKKTIETSVYDHNFYILDSQPTGPDFVVKLPFAPRATSDLAGFAEIRGKEIVFLREMTGEQTVLTDLEGYGGTAADYDIRVENRKTGAGVRQRSDQRMTQLVYWSNPRTVCPEAYIDMRIEPGQEFKWRIAYEFYTVSSAVK
jgi:hypothetical protein